MSRQPNDVTSAVNSHRDSDVRRMERESRRIKPHRDEFVKAKQHAEDLGVSERVSDGVRRLLLQYQKSPLKIFLDAMHEGPLLSDEEIDDDESLTDAQKERLKARLKHNIRERQLHAAKLAAPYLHARPDADKESGDPDHAPGAVAAPTINLTLNRPSNTKIVTGPSKRTVHQAPKTKKPKGKGSNK